LISLLLLKKPNGNSLILAGEENSYFLNVQQDFIWNIAFWFFSNSILKDFQVLYYPAYTILASSRQTHYHSFWWRYTCSGI